MNRTEKRTAVVAVVVWLGGCGGSTLGGGGVAGTTGAGGRAPTGAAGFGGSGGDIAPPGGNVGTGGFSGMGGRYCPPPDPPVCGSLCGNGRIDGCAAPGTPGCPAGPATEECDGADFGTDSCAARGWGSGTLTCAGDCTHVEDGCGPCVPNGANLTSCGPAPFSTERFGIASIAATDSEVGIAGVQLDLFIGAQSLVFARLSSDLSLLSFETIDDLTRPTAFAKDIGTTALARRPSGWLIAACTDRGVLAHAIDAAGRDAGYTEPVGAGYPAYDCDGQSPVLAERPGGGPLALWRNGYGVMMSMIAADGLSWSAPKTIVAGGVAGGEFLAAAWVGDAFAVAVPIESDTPGGVGALRLLRVQPDGTTSELGDFFIGSGVVQASIADGPDAHDIRITFGTYGPDGGTWYWRYDAQAPVGPVRISRLGYDGASGPAVAFGDDLALFFGRSSAAGFAITRVGADGTSSGPVREVTRMPYGFAGSSRTQIVRRGPEVVINFTGPGGQLYLARVTP